MKGWKIYGCHFSCVCIRHFCCVHRCGIVNRRQAMLAFASLWAVAKTSKAQSDSESFHLQFARPTDRIEITLGHQTVSFTAAEIMQELSTFKTKE